MTHFGDIVYAASLLSAVYKRPQDEGETSLHVQLAVLLQAISQEAHYFSLM